MVVAVVAVRMAQVIVDEIVRLVTVRDGLVAATGVMMPRVVAAALIVGRTYLRVLVRDRHRMFVVVSLMLVVQVTVVQVIDVIVVLDRGVAAIGTMDMVTVLVGLMISR